MNPMTTLLGGSALILALGAGAATAQPLSSGTVTVLVPFSAGGSLDLVARLMAENLSAQWGASVIVENQPGAGGIIASRTLVGAQPDGRRLILVSASHALNPLLYQVVPYDTFADFTPIARISEQGNVLLAGTGSPFTSVDDIVEAAQSGGQPVVYGVSGVGTSVHLAGLLMDYMIEGNMEPVQFGGGADTLAALMGNHIPLGFSSIPGAVEQIADGSVRALGVTSLERNPGLPDVPTIDEAGIEGYEVVNWWGLLGPAGMDPELVAFINEGVREALENEAAVERLAGFGIVPDVSTPEEFDALIRADAEKWRPVIEAAGIERQ